MKFRNKTVAHVIDVRSRLEFFFGHVPGAVCIPVQRVGHAALAERGIARDAGILVYCASGSRSAVAASALKSAGFTRVVDGGGMAEVRKHLRAEG
ncbi:MAG: rhodanese-like domain-containing protein [Gemmatimonadota bacterium]|nr:rhodanese-like domain-containing protein [Gemmatimonadota bacterium]MDE3173141.1 rhodanese-like domain-containing protein [Gemmatimonadota bacterium]MDE3215404.1 rhodanese-like domain-containing protein [Gemmatimonadota bacterium]